MEIIEEHSGSSSQQYPDDYNSHMKYIRRVNWNEPDKDELPLIASTFSEALRDGNWWRKRKNLTSCIVEFVLSGDIFYEENGSRRHLKRGDMYITKPGSSVKIISGNATVHQLQLVFKGRLLGTLLNDFNLDNISVIRFKDISSVQEYYEKIVPLMQSRKMSDYVQLSACIYAFLLYISNCSNRTSDDIPEVLSQILRDMHSSFFEHYRMSEYAARASVSKATMERMFKRYLGVSPQEYLIKIRIETAQVIIQGSNNSFQEIAKRVGYKNLYHFSASFRKVTGMTPSEYKKSFQSNN